MKKSKFQQRLEEAAQKHLTTLKTGGDDPTSQTAQDPMDIKLFSINDILDIMKEMEDKKIFKNPMTCIVDDEYRGHDNGIQKCVDILINTAKEGKLKLHRDNKIP